MMSLHLVTELLKASGQMHFKQCYYYEDSNVLGYDPMFSEELLTFQKFLLPTSSGAALQQKTTSGC